MSTPKKVSPSSEWRRMTNKFNTVLKQSMKANDYPTDSAMISSLETTKIHQEIQAITDFRLCNGTEQYLISWHCPSNDIKASWESENTVEAICKEALLKFWMKTVLAEKDGVTSTSADKNVIPSLKANFTRKLKNWILQPLIKNVSDDEGKQCAQALPIISPPKKRPRHFFPEDELSESFYEIEKKQPKLVGIDEKVTVSAHSIDIDSAPSIQINRELGIYNNMTGFSALLKPNEIFDLIDAPRHEIGEVITWNKNVDDDSKSNSYLVTWLYVSNETAETLGLEEKLLQKHFGSFAIDSQRFQLYRKKQSFATIREAPNPIKAYSPHSDSDQSESSTVPPSDPGTFHLGDYRMLAESMNDVSCQTSIELDPYACTYCQSRKGEDKRLSSLRKRRGNTNGTHEDENNELQKKQHIKKELEPQKADEEGDDDLVSIEYEIEKILNYRKVEGTNVDEYYIRWKGFTSHYDTWEPFDNLSSCDKALIIFYADCVGERRQAETELLKLTASGNSTAAKKIVVPPLPPIPEILMEKLRKTAPISDEEIEMAYKVSKTIRKNARWPKKKLRKMLLDLIGEAVGPGSSLSVAAAQDELPVIRHQLLMLESERRKELVLRDLKAWEKRLNNIARGRPEIIVENNYDLAGPPADFKYINDNILGDGVTFPDDPLEGCDCEDSCVKDKSQCCPGKHGKVLAYNSYKRLRVYPGYPIYECNKRCKCGPECANRVVQDGTISLIGTKLCIFRTKNERGWGVKTLRKIKRGTFVCLYAGEIITSEEAENRGQIYENQLGACYLFDLDYYAAEDDSCPFTIDATKMGNIAHFINHSCEPNLCVFNVWADCVDQNLPKLAFFALRDIDKDEELTYDYGTNDDSDQPAPLPVMMTEGDDDESEDAMIQLTSSPSKNRLKPATASGARRACLCGTKTCRKVLF